ncbi:MAG TPA: hypothetical protein P5514_13265 [Bacteroidales bacterium]|nr:hypothetical protein [Bacteroidales bacterium]
MKSRNEKYIRLVLSIFVIIGIIISCSKDIDEMDPCEYVSSKLIDVNTVLFSKISGDTLQYLDLTTDTIPSSGEGYLWKYSFKENETYIEIHYNTYQKRDPEFYQVAPLFNGSTSFEIKLSFHDSTLVNHYIIDDLKIDFKNGLYAYYKFIGNNNSALTITEYGDVFDKIEGSFYETFVNTNNESDSIKINCQFSVYRGCDW